MADDRRFTPPPKAPPIVPEAFDPGKATEDEGTASDTAEERGRDRGVSDFFRRAVSAGFEAANRSKDDVLRVATGEIRSWLDRMELDKELIKALQKMTLEVKAEIRFKPNDEGKLVPVAKAETKVRGPKEEEATPPKTDL
jgi:hypothetical protein